jgi:hypothetical protein
MCTYFLLSSKEGTIGGGCIRIARITYFHSSGSFIFTKQKVNSTYYHYYAPVSSGRSWATEEGMSDASESEAVSTRGLLDPLSGSHYV